MATTTPKEKLSAGSLLAWGGFLAGLFLLILSGVALALALTSLREWLETTWGITFPTPLPSLHWWIMLGLGIVLLLLYFLFRVTGIPLNEAQALRSRGDDYRDYQRATSVFVPWRPRKS